MRILTAAAAVFLIFLLSLPATHLSTQPARSEQAAPGCTPLPPDKKIPALGFELGSCHGEVLMFIDELVKKSKYYENDDIFVKRGSRTILNYISHDPPVKPDLNAFTTLKFKGGLLVTVHASYVYLGEKNATRAYRYFSKTLRADFGRGEETRGAIGVSWETDEILITLLLDTSSPVSSIVRVSVTHKTAE